jgi:hypothetical protein
MILFTHHTGEPHGILGAQVAATFFERKLSIPSIVVGIKRDFSKGQLLRFIDEYYGRKERFVAFSHLCGRKDLIDLARELKKEDFITILGGPQARQDYFGEPETDSHLHRFRGLKLMYSAHHTSCIVPWRLDSTDRIGDNPHVQQGRELDRMVESIFKDRI